MADHTETYAKSRITAAAKFSRAEATAAKVAEDLIATANKMYSEKVAELAKEYDDKIAPARRTRAEALAEATRTKAEDDSTASLAFTNTVAPLAETLAKALSELNVTRATDIASAAVTRAKADAASALTLTTALATPQITLATDLAKAHESYAITLSEIEKDESIASATLEQARLNSLDASDATFDYYGAYSSYYGAGGYGYGYMLSETAQGFFLQGGANILNALQDSVIGLVNLTQMPGNWYWGDQGLGYIDSPDWSYGMFTQETQSSHDWSKFIGGTSAEYLTGVWLGRAATAVDEVGHCAGWISRLLNGGCFVPGTLVTLSELPQGEQLQSALWANDAFVSEITDRFAGSTALLEAPAKHNTTFKIAIEDVPLGARVPTKNPRPWEYDDSLPEPDEATWSKVTITARRKDGQIVDAEILRPTAWLHHHGIVPGKTLPLNTPELQVQGEAYVESLAPCPPIAAGEGSVITARFVTRQVDQVATIEILGPNGQIETITGTTIHPIWSVDRQDWVGLAELYEGERLHAADGEAVVHSVEVKQQFTPVYNIEVHGEHVFEVSVSCVLVHNTCAGFHHFAPRAWGNTLPYGSKWLSWLDEATHTSVHREFSDFLFAKYGKYYNSQSGASWQSMLTWKERYRDLIDFYRSYDRANGTDMFGKMMVEIRGGIQGGHNPLGI